MKTKLIHKSLDFGGYKNILSKKLMNQLRREIINELITHREVKLASRMGGSCMLMGIKCGDEITIYEITKGYVYYEYKIFKPQQ